MSDDPTTAFSPTSHQPQDNLFVDVWHHTLIRHYVHSGECVVLKGFQKKLGEGFKPKPKKVERVIPKVVRDQSTLDL